MPSEAKFVQIMWAATSKIYPRAWKEDSCIIHDTGMAAQAAVDLLQPSFPSSANWTHSERRVPPPSRNSQRLHSAQCTQDLWKKL